MGPEFARLALLALPPIGGFLVLIGVQVALLLLMLCVDWRALAEIEAASDAAAASEASVRARAAAGPAAAAGGKEAAAPAPGAGPDPEKGSPDPPLLSYRELLLHQAFIAPALICAGSFSGGAAAFEAAHVCGFVPACVFAWVMQHIKRRERDPQHAFTTTTMPTRATTAGMSALMNVTGDSPHARGKTGGEAHWSRPLNSPPARTWLL